MLNIIEKLANIVGVIALLYAMYSIVKSIFSNIELFTDTIKDEIYIRIATGIENAVSLKGSYDSFKKETKFQNFNKDIFDQLVEARKKGKQRMSTIDIKLVMSKVGRAKVMDSIK
jgi:hypothetical protein